MIRCIGEKRNILSIAGVDAGASIDDETVEALWQSLPEPPLNDSMDCMPDKRAILSAFGVECVADMDDETAQGIWMSLEKPPLLEQTRQRVEPRKVEHLEHDDLEPLRMQLSVVSERFGTSDPRTLQAKNMLANALCQAGRCSEAEPLLRTLLEAAEQEFGPHPATMQMVSTLARALAEQGKFQEARKYFERSMALSEDFFGFNHPGTLQCAHCVLRAYYEQEDLNPDAEGLLRRVLGAKQEMFGPEHPDVVQHAQDLGRMLVRQDRIAEAQVLSTEFRTGMATSMEKYFLELKDGGFLCNADYVFVKGPNCWKHRGTAIHVWDDVIDLSSGSDPHVFFHYTDDIGFRNITSEGKAASEIWASLKTDGENANAFWVQGVYSVRKPPDKWQDQFQLLDNNFRNMMARDLEKNDESYVKQVYAPRAAYCIPVLVDLENAYDVAVRATPEMQRAGLAPGTSLRGTLLNEPGKSERECVVIRIENAEGRVENAKARLLDIIRVRTEKITKRFGPQHWESMFLQARLARVLRNRGHYVEAEKVLRELLGHCKHKFGMRGVETLSTTSNLALALMYQSRFSNAEDLLRQALEALEEHHCSSDRLAWPIMSNLAEVFVEKKEFAEAEKIYRQILVAQEQHCDCGSGLEQIEILGTVERLGKVLLYQGNLSESEVMCARSLTGHEKLLGNAHPTTLLSVGNLASVRFMQNKMSDSELLSRRALDGAREQLGNLHPETFKIIHILARCLEKQGNLAEAEALLRESFDGRALQLGLDDSLTIESLQELASILELQEKLPDAAVAYTEVLRLYTKKFGPSSTQAAEIQCRLTKVLEATRH